MTGASDLMTLPVEPLAAPLRRSSRATARAEGQAATLVVRPAVAAVVELVAATATEQPARDETPALLGSLASAPLAYAQLAEAGSACMRCLHRFLTTLPAELSPTPVIGCRFSFVGTSLCDACRAGRHECCAAFPLMAGNLADFEVLLGGLNQQLGGAGAGAPIVRAALAVAVGSYLATFLQVDRKMRPLAPVAKQPGSTVAETEWALRRHQDTREDALEVARRADARRALLAQKFPMSLWVAPGCYPPPADMIRAWQNTQPGDSGYASVTAAFDAFLIGVADVYVAAGVSATRSQGEDVLRALLER